MSVLDVSAMDNDDLLLLAEVHRMTSKVIELVGGSVPSVGTPAWRSAEPMARLAGVLVLAEAWLIDDTHAHQIAAGQLRDVSIAISSGMDWRQVANRHVSHTALRGRRDQMEALSSQPYAGGPVEWETSSQEIAA